MTFYFRTSLDPQTTQTLFRQALTSSLDKISDFEETPVTDEFLSQNFDFTTLDILKEYIDDFKVKEVKKNVLEIYVETGAVMKKNPAISLTSLVQLLEYGNIELHSPKIISRFLSMGATKVREELGGV